MQTSLADFIKDTPEGREADDILRSCVHCGFCTATCPTYQLLGDELDGPRGRIYLIKSLLEGQAAGRSTQLHLDRCLTCRACETTCPSGVKYGRLVDIGREQVEKRVPRPFRERLARFVLRRLIPYPKRFAALVRAGQRLRPFLPRAARKLIPAGHTPTPSSLLKDASIPGRSPRALPLGKGEGERGGEERGTGQGVGVCPPRVQSHKRTMLILEGCVQPALAPSINAAAARVLDRLGITAIPAEGCCGAVSYHLSAVEEARAFMRSNIDRWWPWVERGIEAIVSTASGCGSLVKDYGDLSRHEAAYAEKAARIAVLAKDISEVIGQEDLSALSAPSQRPLRIAFQSPCSLQHGQKLGGVTESILCRLGFQLIPVAEAHLCCGSAGTYSILQRRLARQLLKNKIKSLEAGHPDLIATANIGCYSFLQQEAHVPVKHWIELLDPNRAR